MNEKKSNGFAALILSVVVALVAVFGVKFAGGSMVTAEPADTDKEVSGGMTAGTYTGEAQGLQSTVTVSITVDENGVITEVTVDSSGETVGFGADAAEELAAQILAAQSAEIDGVSGSTMTSNAAKEAAAAALAQAGGNGGAGGANGGDSAAAASATYTAEAQGIQSAVVVTMTIDGNGVITEVTVDSSGETPNFGADAAEELAAQILEAQSAEIDGVSGSTITSDAARKAAADCLQQAAAAN